MKRLDQVLVSLNLSPSRTKAQAMIDAGEVEVFVHGDWRVADQPSLAIEPEHVRLKGPSTVLKYVSRGGLKLEGALKHLKLNVQGLSCLDIGISTGGFTDCLLQHGASQVLGIDVGHGQLDERLKADPRVTWLEGVNVKDLPSELYVQDLCVVDLSFISLLSVWPVLADRLSRNTAVLALVKPQFEVGQENLDKKGIVRDESLFDDVKARVLRTLQKYGFSVIDYFPCSLRGQDGNQEFFVYSRRS